MPTLGPVYCGTPASIVGFPAEGINTWSNLVIIAFGILAAYLILRLSVQAGRKPRTMDLWVLAVLLIGNGIGSFLWHGYRTSTFLILDSLPGALFLLAFVYLWLRRFYKPLHSAVAMIVFFALIAGLSVLGVTIGVPTFVAFVPVVLLYAGWLIYKSQQSSPRAARLGGWALASALLALVFRTADLLVCPYFPLGTHFLWHIFLSLAAFLGILVLLELDKNI